LATKGQAVAWCGAQYLLTDKGELIDVARKIQAWNYSTDRQGGFRVADDQRVWFTEGEYPNSPAYMLWGTLPDQKVGDTAAGILSDSAQRLLTPGDEVRVELAASCPSDLQAQVSRDCEAAVREAGFRPSQSQGVQFRLTASSNDTGKSTTYIPLGGSGTQTTVRVMQLDCEASLLDADGANLWQTSTILGMPQPYMISAQEASIGLQQALEKKHWEAFGRWASGITLPRMIVRVEQTVYAIPGWTELIDTVSADRQPPTRADRFREMQEKRQQEFAEEQRQRKEQFDRETIERFGPVPQQIVELKDVSIQPSQQPPLSSDQVTFPPVTPRAVAINPADLDYVAMADSRGNVGIWSLAKKRTVFTRENVLMGIGDLSYSADGQFILATSLNDARLLYLLQARLLARPLVNRSLNAADLSADGQFVACVASPQIAIYDVKKQKLGTPIVTAPARIEAVTVSPDKQTLAAFSDGSVQIFDARTGEQKQKVRGRYLHNLSRLVFAAGGERLIGWGYSSIHVWDTSSWTEQLMIRRDRPAGSIISREPVAVSSDGSLLALGTGNDVLLLDADSGQAMFRISASTGPTQDLDFSPDGAKLATVGDDGFLKTWQIR
jgi:WD40 repeat protein